MVGKSERMIVALLTVREKNQVTVPRRLMDAIGLKPGDPIEFEALPDGGIGLYPYGHQARRPTAWDLAVSISAKIPGIEDTELDPPEHPMNLREVPW